jgi:hypothetical protein
MIVGWLCAVETSIPTRISNHILPRYRYTRFIGNASDWREYSNPRYFETNSGDSRRVYAWNLYPGTGCPATIPYICEYPASVFPCYPP